MDPYATLGVPTDAATREVKRAWRKIAQRCHPDKVEAAGLTGTEADRHAVRFREAREAWSVLGTQASRDEYDAQVAQARTDALEAERQQHAARVAAQQAWEREQARRVQEQARREQEAQQQQERLVAAVEQEAMVAAHQVELAAWLRRAERRERARQRAVLIMQARRAESGRQLLLSGGRALAHGVSRARTALAAMMLEEL
tara:strand:+ start:344 stop:946 length:603 start_codon:yes stop_codon:yes gene_type:complete